MGTYRSTTGSSTGEDVSGVAANAGTARATTITRAIITEKIRFVIVHSS
jgi:hypothetical protein